MSDISISFTRDPMRKLQACYALVVALGRALPKHKPPGEDTEDAATTASFDALTASIEREESHLFTHLTEVRDFGSSLKYFEGIRTQCEDLGQLGIDAILVRQGTAVLATLNKLLSQAATAFNIILHGYFPDESITPNADDTRTIELFLSSGKAFVSTTVTLAQAAEESLDLQLSEVFLSAFLGRPVPATEVAKVTPEAVQATLVNQGLAEIVSVAQQVHDNVTEACTVLTQSEDTVSPSALEEANKQVKALGIKLDKCLPFLVAGEDFFEVADTLSRCFAEMGESEVAQALEYLGELE